MVSVVDLAGTPWRATPVETDEAKPAANPFGVVWILLLWQTAALIFQVDRKSVV